jgi:hypothetical protein
MVQCPLGIDFPKLGGKNVSAYKLHTAEATCHIQASQDWHTLMHQVAAVPSWAALAEQPEGLMKRLRELHANLQEAQGGTAAFCKVSTGSSAGDTHWRRLCHNSCSAVTAKREINSTNVEL